MPHKFFNECSSDLLAWSALTNQKPPTQGGWGESDMAPINLQRSVLQIDLIVNIGPYAPFSIRQKKKKCIYTCIMQSSLPFFKYVSDAWLRVFSRCEHWSPTCIYLLRLLWNFMPDFTNCTFTLKTWQKLHIHLYINARWKKITQCLSSPSKM